MLSKKVIEAVFILLFIPIVTAQNIDIPILDLSEGSDIAPLVLHEEYSEFTLDSFLVKSWIKIDSKGFKLYNVSGYCKTYSYTNKSIIIWDYELYVNDDLKDRNSFVTFRYNKSGVASATLFCYKIAENDTVINLFETYRIGHLSENIEPISFNISRYFLFPFDWYSFDIYRNRIDVPYIYSVKFIFPRSFEADYNESAIIGDQRVDKQIVLSRNINGTIISIPIGQFFVYGELSRPNLQSFEGDKRVVIFPPTKLVSKKETIGNRTDIEAHLIIRRSSNDINFFLIFFSGFIVITVLYFSKKISQAKTFELTILLWIAQEGLYQLLPTVRPVSLTIFDLIFLIPIVCMILHIVISFSLKTITMNDTDPQKTKRFLLKYSIFIIFAYLSFGIFSIVVLKTSISQTLILAVINIIILFLLLFFMNLAFKKTNIMIRDFSSIRDEKKRDLYLLTLGIFLSIFGNLIVSTLFEIYDQLKQYGIIFDLTTLGYLLIMFIIVVATFVINVKGYLTPSEQPKN